MYDANLVLQAATTKTATANGTGVNLVAGTPRRGLKARFLISSHSSVATAGTVFTPSIDHSDDDTTYYSLAVGVPITSATAAAAKEVFVPFETSKTYVRATMTVSPSSGTPSIVYSCDVGLARP
jgi:hypothetical protein